MHTHHQKEQKTIPSMRIELTTLGLLDPRSNQLSYEGIAVGVVKIICNNFVFVNKLHNRNLLNSHFVVLSHLRSSLAQQYTIIPLYSNMICIHVYTLFIVAVSSVAAFSTPSRVLNTKLNDVHISSSSIATPLYNQGGKY